MSRSSSAISSGRSNSIGAVFGLSVESEDRANELVQLKLGRSHISIRRRNGPTGVDHFAIGLDRFNRDAVMADLRRRGATPQDGNNAGLHVLDPDECRFR